MKSFIIPQKLNTFFKSFISLFFLKNKYDDLHLGLKFFFSELFPQSKIYLTGAGRVSIYQSLQAFKSVHENKNEVIVTAFTCASVIDSILRAELKPVYADISIKTFGTDPISVNKKISKNTLAVIAQHTFGFPCDILKIKKNIENKNIFLIEDCAISFNSKIKNKLIGSFGDVSIFSFDHSKPINLLMGGVIVCNNKKFNNFFIQNSSEFNKPNFIYEVSMLFYMFFDILTYIFDNKNYQQFIRITYALIKKFRIVGNPIIKKFFDKTLSFKNYNRISYISLIVFKFEKSRIIKIILKRKINYKLINSFSNNNVKIISPDIGFDCQIYPLRMILVIKDCDRIKVFLQKYFDSRFFWFKEPIIARERDFDFYHFYNNTNTLKNSTQVFDGLINISLNLHDAKNKIFFKKFQNIINANYN